MFDESWNASFRSHITMQERPYYITIGTTFVVECERILQFISICKIFV